MDRAGYDIPTIGLEPENAYLHNAKELHNDAGLDWYNYGFRFYDPAIGRFTGVDPISDQFPHVSTYNYAENSPIANIDLWGLQAVNFMSKFKKPKNLDRKTPRSNAQRQFYSGGVQNTKTSFSEMKEVSLK